MTVSFDDFGHFMASIEIMPRDPEFRGKTTSNLMRWGFWYADYKENFGVPAGQWDVWPIFLDEAGVPIPEGIECSGTMQARMHILFDTSVPKHFKRLQIGTLFHLKDGDKVMAIGTVTKLGI